MACVCSRLHASCACLIANKASPPLPTPPTTHDCVPVGRLQPHFRSANHLTLHSTPYTFCTMPTPPHSPRPTFAQQGRPTLCTSASTLHPLRISSHAPRPFLQPPPSTLNASVARYTTSGSECNVPSRRQGGQCRTQSHAHSAEPFFKPPRFRVFSFKLPWSHVRVSLQ